MKTIYSADFELWCRDCVKITDKMTGELVPFILNGAQRRLYNVMEGQRLAGKPVRIILLKARQWGGSTLVQIYIAWLQIVVFKGRNSIIVGHKRNSAFAIKNMLRTVLKNYPSHLLEKEKLSLVNVRESKDIQELTGRNCSICLTSSYSPDAGRGLNFSFAHLSEVAFWNSNRNVDPNDLIRTVTGSIPSAANTVIVLESTANGMNSFFYNEWQRAKEGKSAYTPVFVSWNEIEIYRRELDDSFDLASLDDYERDLLRNGCSREQVYWYHEKRKEFNEHTLMKAEFPTTDVEAFENSVQFVFSTHEQERITENITSPIEIDVDNFKKWSQPVVEESRPRETFFQGAHSFKMPPVRRNPFSSNYLAMLTIGSEKAKERPSVLSIWDVKNLELPSLVGQWQGNLPLNNLATMAISWATKYDNALLVVENNDLYCSDNERQQGYFLLDDIFKIYRNLYRDSRGNFLLDLNRKNFAMMFYELILSSRHGQYIDHDEASAKAVATMIELPNGRFHAQKAECFTLLLNRAETLFSLRLFRI